MTCSSCTREILSSGPFDLSVTNRQQLTHPKRTIEWVDTSLPFAMQIDEESSQ